MGLGFLPTQGPSQPEEMKDASLTSGVMPSPMGKSNAFSTSTNATPISSGWNFLNKPNTQAPAMPTLPSLGADTVTLNPTATDKSPLSGLSSNPGASLPQPAKKSTSGQTQTANSVSTPPINNTDAGTVSLPGQTPAGSNALGADGMEGQAGATQPSLFQQLMRNLETLPPDKDHPGALENDATDSSKLVMLYKFGFAFISGIGQGFIFGSPLKVSVGLAVAGAAFQSLVAMKISKQDMRLSRAILRGSEKMTARKKSTDPQKDKERSLAFLWGGLSASVAFTESLINAISGSTKAKANLQDRLKALSGKVAGTTGWHQTYMNLQISAIDAILTLKGHATNLGKHLEGALGSVGIQVGSSSEKALLPRAWGLIQKYHKPLGVIGITMGSFICAYTQSMIASHASKIGKKSTDKTPPTLTQGTEDPNSGKLSKQATDKPTGKMLPTFPQGSDDLNSRTAALTA